MKSSIHHFYFKGSLGKTYNASNEVGLCKNFNDYENVNMAHDKSHEQNKNSFHCLLFYDSFHIVYNSVGASETQQPAE